jgi:hypothetical protein
MWWTDSLASSVRWVPFLSYDFDAQRLAALVDDEDEMPVSRIRAHPQYTSISFGYDHNGRVGDGQSSVAARTDGLDDSRELKWLVDRFVKYSHSKQPVVDPAALYRQIGVVGEEGLRWDVETCLLVGKDHTVSPSYH